MKKNVLLTGATGFVMSHIACMLIKRNCRVFCLARSRGGESARERVDNALHFVDPSVKNSYVVLEGDITKDNLGIKESDIEGISFKEVWHGAASVMFSDKHEEMIRRINVGGTRNVLDFIDKYNIPRLHYFSTICVCGYWKLGRFFETDLYEGQKFKNSYEATKLEAEKLVQEHQGIFSSIYRLGIVVGDSRTGKANSFSGYYSLAKIFYSLGKLIKRGIRTENKKNDYAKKGFYEKGDGILSFPVKIPCCPRENVNLVTIDYVVKVIDVISQDLNNHGVFHIVNQNPPTVKWLFDESLKILGLSDFQIVDLTQFHSDAASRFFTDISTNHVLQKVERAIWDNCGVYIPYLVGEPTFDDFLTRTAMGGKLHPPITREILKKLLNFATKVEFGKNMEEAKEAALVVS